MCHLVCNHTLCHSVTWCRTIIHFRCQSFGQKNTCCTFLRNVLYTCFTSLPEHFYTRSPWLYNIYYFLLCHPSLYLRLPWTHWFAGMTVRKQWNCYTPHLSNRNRERRTQSQFTPKWQRNNIKLTTVPLPCSLKPFSHSDNNGFSIIVFFPRKSAHWL